MSCLRPAQGKKSEEMSEKERFFTATLYRIGVQRCVRVPDQISKAFGGLPGSVEARQATIPVRIRVGDTVVSTSLLRNKGGGFRLVVAKALCDAAGTDAGDEITLAVGSDPSRGEPDLPQDLMDRLAATPHGMENLGARSPADRRQLVRWLESAKAVETRQRRLQQAVERILKGPPSKTSRKPPRL